MAVMTIRGLDEKMVEMLKKRAKQEGMSVNATLLKILKEALGLQKKPRKVIYTDLDQLAGTWSNKDFEEFMKKTKDFEKIDKTLWE
jgi:plasmid stability protein